MNIESNQIINSPELLKTESEKDKEPAVVADGKSGDSFSGIIIEEPKNEGSSAFKKKHHPKVVEIVELPQLSKEPIESNLSSIEWGHEVASPLSEVHNDHLSEDKKSKVGEVNSSDHQIKESVKYEMNGLGDVSKKLFAPQEKDPRYPEYNSRNSKYNLEFKPDESMRGRSSSSSSEERPRDQGYNPSYIESPYGSNRGYTPIFGSNNNPQSHDIPFNFSEIDHIDNNLTSNYMKAGEEYNQTSYYQEGRNNGEHYGGSYDPYGTRGMISHTEMNKLLMGNKDYNDKLKEFGFSEEEINRLHYFRELYDNCLDSYLSYRMIARFVCFILSLICAFILYWLVDLSVLFNVEFSELLSAFAFVFVGIIFGLFVYGICIKFIRRSVRKLLKIPTREDSLRRNRETRNYL